MLDAQANIRLTQVDAGTPAGELLRRYWHPLCPSEWLTPHRPVVALKVLGDSLVVFRSPDGSYTALPERCPHRGASLRYGFVEDGGIRCSYHGWLFDRDGECVEMPFELRKSHLRIDSYPVQERAGLLFAYLGQKDSMPVLPQWDILTRDGGHYSIQLQDDLGCNWLQVQENAADVTHTTFLHAYRFRKLGLLDRSGFGRPMKRFGFQPFYWGIVKSWVYEDESGQEKEGWGNLLIFPTILRLETEMHWRVPVDNTTTRIFILGFTPADEVGDSTVEVVDLPKRNDESGRYFLDTFYSQDAMAWETAGEVFDRTQEHLGASDAGISMFRRMLASQIDRVEAGLGPDIAVSDDDSIIDLREWMGGYLPMSAPPDPTTTLRRPRAEVFDERHRTFEVPAGIARSNWPNSDD